jgi:hypothetical protein
MYITLTHTLSVSLSLSLSLSVCVSTVGMYGLFVTTSLTFDEMVAQGKPTARAYLACKQQYITTTQTWYDIQVVPTNVSL